MVEAEKAQLREEAKAKEERMDFVSTAKKQDISRENALTSCPANHRQDNPSRWSTHLDQKDQYRLLHG